MGRIIYRNGIEYSMNTVKRWIAFPIANLSPSLSERLRLYSRDCHGILRAYCATIYRARDCTRSFDTRHSRLKIFHHRMLRDRTLLSPSSLLPLLHAIILSSCLSTKGQDLRYLSFFLFSFFIFLPPVSRPISSSLSSPDQVRTQEDSLHLSFSTSSILPSLSRTHKTDTSFPPQGFGLTCLLQGGGKESRGCETRGKEGGCRSNSRWFNSLPAFFFSPRNRWTVRVCVWWTRMIGG